MTWKHDDHDRNPEHEANLDQALDALLNGDPTWADDLDPAMRATVGQMYAWADLAGIGQQAERPAPGPARHGPVPATVTPVDLSRERQRRHSPRSVLMKTLSAIAAVLILGLGIYGAVPHFSNDEPSRTEIAFQAVDPSGSPAATASVTSPPPPDVIYTGGAPIQNGDGTTLTPPIGAVLTGVNGSDVRYPVSPNECDATPRSREGVVNVLETPPGDVALVQEDGSSVDDATLGQLQKTFREWQACRRFGDTWQAAALETDQFIRTDIYGDGGTLGNIKPISTAYSDAAIGGLLDGRIDQDNTRKTQGELKAKGAPGSEGGLNLNLWVINTSAAGAGLSNAPYIVGNGGKSIQVTAVWTSAATTSPNPFPAASVTFRLVDGQWCIDNWVYLAVFTPGVD